MASNAGTGLIDGNGKRHQLYRATIAFTNLKNAMQVKFQQCSDRHRISSIVFNHHQSAISDDISFGDASSPKVRIDDAMYQ